MPLMTLETHNLAVMTSLIFRGLGPQKTGVFPFGMPTRMAFFTICIRHLFER